MLSRCLTENTKSLKCDLSPCANVMVYHIGVSATVCSISDLCLWKSRCHWPAWLIKWEGKPKNLDCHFNLDYWVISVYSFIVSNYVVEQHEENLCLFWFLPNPPCRSRNSNQQPCIRPRPFPLREHLNITLLTWE